MVVVMMMMMINCRYQEFRPFTVSGHDGLSISQGTLYAKERFHHKVGGCRQPPIQ